MQYLDIRVTGEKEEINELLVILRKIQWCGSVGEEPYPSMLMVMGVEDFHSN